MTYRYKYDLHIHTCLSPCGDDDMSPNNIANMAVIKERRIIAVTDHNTAGNARAVSEAAESLGLIVIAGMEVTTEEEIHALVLFGSVGEAEVFESEVVRPARIAIKNDEAIFGRQVYMDSGDKEVGTEANLLINATSLSLDRLKEAADKLEAVCIPAHIDKEENGLLSILGSFPGYLDFHFVEIKDKNKNDELMNHYNLQNVKIFNNSDAHYLWDISESECFLCSEEPIEAAADFIRLCREKKITSEIN